MLWNADTIDKMDTDESGKFQVPTIPGMPSLPDVPVSCSYCCIIKMPTREWVKVSLLSVLSCTTVVTKGNRDCISACLTHVCT